jgi:hypothetical protein
VGGLYVGSQGLESTRSFELGQLHTYVVNLCRLAVACAVLRVLWVINLSIDVQVAVDKNNKEARDPTAPTDPDNPTPHVIDQKVVSTFEIQVQQTLSSRLLERNVTLNFPIGGLALFGLLIRMAKLRGSSHSSS